MDAHGVFQSEKSAKSGDEHGKVKGIGGLFFRAHDSKALSKWYAEHLGITSVGENYDALPWQQEAGSTVFAPFPQDTEYFGTGGKTWMINFRVADLDAMAAQLRAAGIAVTIDPQAYPHGRCARLTDPEGNPVELWPPERRDAPK